MGKATNATTVEVESFVVVWVVLNKLFEKENFEW